MRQGQHCQLQIAAVSHEELRLRGKTFLHNAKHLLAYGVLDEHDYQMMENISRARNALIHGYKFDPIESAEVKSAIGRTREMLDECRRRLGLEPILFASSTSSGGY